MLNNMSGRREELVLMNCLEIMLSKEPKSVRVKRDREELKFLFEQGKFADRGE